MTADAAWLRLFDDEVWAKVLRRDPCSYCGEPSDTVEHVDPRGSRSTITNGVGACRVCNHERGSVPLMFYLVWRGSSREESFKRWNWRVNAPVIRAMQIRAKRRRLGLTIEPSIPEDRVSGLRVPLSQYFIEFPPPPDGEP